MMKLVEGSYPAPTYIGGMVRVRSLGAVFLVTWDAPATARIPFSPVLGSAKAHLAGCSFDVDWESVMRAPFSGTGTPRRGAW